MKRLQPSKNKNGDTNTDISSVQNLVPVPLKRKRKRSPDKEKDADTSDFEDTLDQRKTWRAESNSNEESNDYSLRSKYPPVLDDEDEDAECNTNKGLNPIRLQQPPAYISVNLMKIKMERDYVPVVRLKRELAQDVKPEIVHSYDAHENSSSASVESTSTAHEINEEYKLMNVEKNLQPATSVLNESSVELNPHEPEHYFNCIQTSRVKLEYSETEQPQQNQQEHVEETEIVKEVADASTSMETSENEMEKETATKLKERIQKCIQNVISLYRENMEIQTSLKSEITQLKHVNNQLKNNIVDLNSSSTLQQNENKELKSQLAEQQREIEQLKNKLKPSVKIQLAVENQTLVSKTGQKMDTNSNPIKIGDWYKKVLSQVFDYLDVRSLKASRFVSRRWREAAGKILLKNFHLVCDDKMRCENTLINWLKNSHFHSHFHSDSTSTPIALKLFSGDAKRTLHLLQKFPPLSCSIRELIFSEKVTTEILYEILKLLPNLEALDTKSLDLSSNQNWLDDVRNPNKLDLLVQKLKTLNRLKLDYGMTKELAQQFFRHGRELELIQNLELHAAGMNFMSQFMRNSLHNWRITHFTLDVDGHYNVGGIRNFLLTISPTLKHLKLILNSSQKRLLTLAPSAFQPWTDDWILPLGLTRVETLKIERAIGKETFVVKCLVAALRLPRLKKLTVDDVLFGKELEENIDKWNSHESAGGRKLASQSLEELEVVPQFPHCATSSVSFLCHQSKIPRHPWPGLKSLKCSWNSSEPFDASFLSELRNLERLELTILLSWNHGESTKNESCQQAKSSAFNLGDLKDLKSFGLKFPENRQRYKNFAYSLVEKELKFMKSLQCVQFHRVVIDATSLKSALGPNVSIIFTN